MATINDIPLELLAAIVQEIYNAYVEDHPINMTTLTYGTLQSVKYDKTFLSLRKVNKAFRTAALKVYPIRLGDPWTTSSQVAVRHRHALEEKFSVLIEDLHQSAMHLFGNDLDLSIDPWTTDQHQELRRLLTQAGSQMLRCRDCRSSEMCSKRNCMGKQGKNAVVKMARWPYHYDVGDSGFWRRVRHNEKTRRYCKRVAESVYPDGYKGLQVRD